VSTEITTAFVKKFAAGVRMLQQQMGSNLRTGAMVDGEITGDRAFYDQVDATAMSEVTNRHGDTEYTDTPHRRRMVTLRTYEVADLVDPADQRRLLNDPINPYTRSMAAAAGRRVDDTLIAAFDATAATEVDGSGTAAFDTTNYQWEADGTASTGTGTALDIGGLTKAREVLEAAENEEDDGENSWHAALTAKARQDLLDNSTVTSSDYNTIKALVNGQIDTFVGFNFHKSQRLGLVSAAIKLPFWVKKSMQIAMGQEARAFMDILPMKRHATQVRYEIDLGATRMDEKGVVILELLA